LCFNSHNNNNNNSSNNNNNQNQNNIGNGKKNDNNKQKNLERLDFLSAINFQKLRINKIFPETIEGK
jgi:hypothetical protein